MEKINDRNKKKINKGNCGANELILVFIVMERHGSHSLGLK